MKKMVKIFTIVFAIFVSSAKASMGMNGINGDTDAVKKWLHIESLMKVGIKSLTDAAFPLVINVTQELNLTTSCRKDGMYLFNGIQELDPESIRFLDASAKMIDGLTVGALSNSGLYEECLKTEVSHNQSNSSSTHLYRGQYCTLELRPPLPAQSKDFKMDSVLKELENFTKSNTIVAEFAKNAQIFYLSSFRLGICVPSGCTLEDMKKISSAVGDSVSVHASITHCEVKEERKIPPIAIAVIFIYSATCLLVLVGSLLDRNSRETSQTGTLSRVLLQFSFFKNYKKLQKVDERQQFKCLNGIRFITVFCIVLTHSYVFINFENAEEMLFLKEFAKDFAFQAVLNFHVVDTFFVIGGTVVSYAVISQVKIKRQPFSILSYIFKKLGRILPVYIYLILFIFLLELFGSGPFWKEIIDTKVHNCYEKWWYNVLFINNFLNTENMCAYQTWYLACDFQFYLIALIILIPLIKWPKLGVSLDILAIILTASYCGYLTYINDLPPTVLLNNQHFTKTKEYLNTYLFRPYSHAGPYFIGVLLGYALAVKDNLKIPLKTKFLGCIIAFAFAFSTVYGTVDWNKGKEPTLVEAIAYASLSKLAWALSVGWLILLCATQHKGVLNRFLAWKGFVPLGRLSFTAYLIHPIVMLVYMGNLQIRLQSYHFTTVWLFFGHLCITFVVSFLVSMLVEAPFTSLMKLAFQTNVVEKNNVISDETKMFSIQTLSLHCDGKTDISNTDFDSLLRNKNNDTSNTSQVHEHDNFNNDEINAKKFSISELMMYKDNEMMIETNDVGTNFDHNEIETKKIGIVNQMNTLGDEIETKTISIAELMMNNGNKLMNEKNNCLEPNDLETNSQTSINEIKKKTFSIAELMKENGVELMNEGNNKNKSLELNELETNTQTSINESFNENDYCKTNEAFVSDNNEKNRVSTRFDDKCCSTDNIDEIEKEKKDDVNLDVKATFYPGLGWKLEN